MSKIERIGLALYALGLLVALWTLGPRISEENRHHTTEILLDNVALEEWAAQEKGSGDTLSQKLLAHNISSLAFSELHLDQLVEDGTLVAQSSTEFLLTLESGALATDGDSKLHEFVAEHRSGTYLIFTDLGVAADLVAQLTILFGPETELLLHGRVLWLPLPERTLRALGFGFDVKAITAAVEKGYSIWLRPENRVDLTEQQLEELFEIWNRLPNIQGVIFGGGLNEAMGYPDLLETLAEKLTQNGWKLGYIELPERAQQKGIESLVRALPGQTVRVMAVAPAHQAKLDPFRVLGMYSLGARERNLRVLYVRPYAEPSRPELDEEFLFSLPRELEKQGPASVFDPQNSPGPGVLVTLCLSLAGGAVALLILQALGLEYRVWWLALLLIPALGGLGAVLIHKEILFRSLLALCIGVGVPVYAFLRVVYPVVTEPEGHLWEGVKVLLLTSLLSFSAGIFLAALLSDTTFLLGLDRFRGVKLLTLGTPLFVILAFLLKRYSNQEILLGLKSYVAVYQALLAGLMAVLLGVLYLRTGNDAGGTASEGERTLRVLMDRALGVRPRFKEFMLAHPAMILAPWFAYRSGFLPTLILVVLAGIGQAGIVDTFAHVHTPLEVTAVRVILGVVFGAIVGAVGMGLGNWLEPRLRRLSSRGR